MVQAATRRMEQGDVRGAIGLLERAVELGSADAAYELGRILHSEFGGEDDRSRAFSLFRRAADAGSVAGLRRTARCLRYGEGCREDRERARALWATAAGLGDAEACWALAWDVADGSPWHDRQRSIALFERGADLGHAVCELMIAEATLMRKPLSTAPAVVFGRLMRAEASWSRRAKYLAAVFLQNGIGCVADPVRALRYCFEAANLGEPDARRMLVERYGLNIERAVGRADGSPEPGPAPASPAAAP